MAESDKQSQAQTVDAAGAPAHKGWEHRRFAFTSVANAETHDIGIRNIRDVAWTPLGAGDAVAVTFASTGVVTFNCPGVEAGTLHVWSGADR